MESARPRFEYLVCPRCGTRYLASTVRGAAAGPGEKPRWFSCIRCNKRVQSADLVEPEPVGEPS